MKQKTQNIKLEPGMLIETNYSGPYRIKSIARECTCPSFYDTINPGDPPPRPPHMHIICSHPDGKGEFYLNGYNEKTLQSTDQTYDENDKLVNDYITILDQDIPIQKTFF